MRTNTSSVSGLGMWQCGGNIVVSCLVMPPTGNNNDTERLAGVSNSRGRHGKIPGALHEGPAQTNKNVEENQLVSSERSLDNTDPFSKRACTQQPPSTPQEPPFPACTDHDQLQRTSYHNYSSRANPGRTFRPPQLLSEATSKHAAEAFSRRPS